MELAMIGLGRMGGAMTERLVSGGHCVVGWGRDPATIERAASKGAVAATDLADAVKKLAPPRHVWLMLPAGEAVSSTLQSLTSLLEPGDVIIDGGNSRYTDSMKRAGELAASGLLFLDAGTSGGIWGLSEGYCLMVGGDRPAFERIEPLLRTLAPPDGYAHVGPSGAGHFAKMIHNGIEYGMLQAYGEGFEILQDSPLGFDLAQVAHLWNHGSVVRSWMLELAGRVFRANPSLDGVRAYVEDSGEGRWTVAEAIDRNIPAPVITLSLLARLASRRPESFSAKTIAALRGEFGGHAVKKTG